MPKGLLEIDGTALVARSVEMLRAHGVRHVRIVTRHLNDPYEAMFGSVSDVELIHNPDYASTGSLLSLLTGLKDVAGSVVVLDSDLIFETAALAPVRSQKTCIVVSGETNATDECYVWTRDGAHGIPALEFISKQIAARDVPHFGEMIGVTCFSANDAARLLVVGLAEQAKKPKAGYEDAVIALAQDSEVKAVLIDDLAWTEVDNEAMLARALYEVWPKIKRRDAIG